MKGRTIFAKPFLKGEELRSHKEEVGMRRVFIVGLPYTFRDQNLRTLLEPLGPLEEAFIAKEPDFKNKSRGFGYATFKFLQDANNALDLGAIYSQGVKIEIVPFKKREALFGISFHSEANLGGFEKKESPQYPSASQRTQFEEKKLNQFSEEEFYSSLNNQEFHSQDTRRLHHLSKNGPERPIPNPQNSKNKKIQKNKLLTEIDIGVEIEPEEAESLWGYQNKRDNQPDQLFYQDLEWSKNYHQDRNDRNRLEEASYPVFLEGENYNFEDETGVRSRKGANNYKFGLNENFLNKNLRRRLRSSQDQQGFKLREKKNYSKNHKKLFSKNPPEKEFWNSSSRGYDSPQQDYRVRGNDGDLVPRLNQFQKVKNNYRKWAQGRKEPKIEENYRRQRLPPYQRVDNAFETMKPQNHQPFLIPVQKNTIVRNDDEEGPRGHYPHYLDLISHSGSLQGYEDDDHPQYWAEDYYHSEYLDQDQDGRDNDLDYQRWNELGRDPLEFNHPTKTLDSKRYYHWDQINEHNTELRRSYHEMLNFRYGAERCYSDARNEPGRLNSDQNSQEIGYFNVEGDRENYVDDQQDFGRIRENRVGLWNQSPERGQEGFNLDSGHGLPGQSHPNEFGSEDRNIDWENQPCTLKNGFDGFEKSLKRLLHYKSNLRFNTLKLTSKPIW